tara:strand:+ start:5001 stop:5582 length:582 start_codon:yes stop_codon:yes gene_type:complete
MDHHLKVIIQDKHKNELYFDYIREWFRDVFDEYFVSYENDTEFPYFIAYVVSSYSIHNLQKKVSRFLKLDGKRYEYKIKLLDESPESFISYLINKPNTIKPFYFIKNKEIINKAANIPFKEREIYKPKIIHSKNRSNRGIVDKILKTIPTNINYKLNSTQIYSLVTKYFRDRNINIKLRELNYYIKRVNQRLS